MTKSQKTQISSITGLLTGNYMTPSAFVKANTEHTDEYTGSILVTLIFEEHVGQIWVRKGGAVTDINGINLKKKGQFCKLPKLKEIAA